MAVIYLPGGVGQSTGDALATASPLTVNGNVWYVDSATGDDSNDGRNKANPFATLQQAVTDSATGDVIVLVDGHTETITSEIAISNSITIIGGGRDSSGLPTVKLTNNQSSGYMLNITSTSCFNLRNVWIEENAQTNASSRIYVNNAATNRFHGLYVQCGANDTGPAFGLTDGVSRFEDCTFLCTNTDNSSQPSTAIECLSTKTYPVALWLTDCTFDDITYGFSKYWAVYAPADLDIFFENLTMRGTDIYMDQASLGYINIETSARDVRIDWADIG